MQTEGRAAAVLLKGRFRLLWRTALILLRISLGTVQVACVDWDSLRQKPDAQGGEVGDADARTDRDPGIAGEPLVHWEFALLREGMVDDAAPLAPSMPLSLSRLSGNAPVVEGEKLWLRGNLLHASIGATQELGRAVTEAGGALTAILWFQTNAIPQNAFLLGSDGRAFSLTVRDAELLLEVATTSSVITVAYPLPFPAREQLHQLAFTYRPGLAALVTCYLDGEAVAVAGEENPMGVSNLDWPTATKGQTETLRVSDGQLDDLRVSAAAIFAEELRAAEIRRLFAAGSSRL